MAPVCGVGGSQAAKMGMAFIWCVLVVIWVGLGWFGAKWVPYHGQQLASECILSFFLPFHRHAHASYLHTAHVRSSKITPVSPEKTPRFAEKYSPFRTFRFPFRTSRSRFAGFFFFDWRSNKKYHPEGAALCCMVVYCTYPTLQCHSRAEMTKNFCETGAPSPVSHGRFVRFSAVPLKPSVSQGCNPWVERQGKRKG